VEIVVTEAGRRALAAALPRARDAQDAFFGRLGSKRLIEFGRMLDDLLAAEGLSAVAAPIVNPVTEEVA
jgi:uncharacterized membrane protein